MASYRVNPAGVEHAERMIDARQYVLRSVWGEVQPRAADENEYLETHGWEEYAVWHLGLTDGAAEETKARYAFVYGDFRRVPAWVSSPAATGPPSGATRRSSWLPTTCCNGSTRWLGEAGG
jgi:hypothetical protein